MGHEADLARGLQTGSGAMESLRRTGCQLRTKISGAKWLAKTAQAILGLRMLHLVGDWDALWKQPNLPQEVTTVFNKKAKSIDDSAEAKGRYGRLTDDTVCGRVRGCVDHDPATGQDLVLMRDRSI